MKIVMKRLHLDWKRDDYYTEGTVYPIRIDGRTKAWQELGFCFDYKPFYQIRNLLKGADTDGVFRR